jgi:hypothetical protein
MRSRQGFPIPDEQYRIEHYTNGEPPLRRYQFLVMEYKTDSDCIEKIRAVMALVAQFNEENWAADEYWRQSLPKWFLDIFREEYTAQETREILAKRMDFNEQWPLGAWLDLTREREWEWWSMVKNDTQFTIYFLVESYPYSIDTLKVLIEAAGGRVIYEF